MANLSHLRTLNEGASIWNSWRKSNPEVIPDLSEASLPGADLSGMNLTKANFTKANLDNAVFTDADLTGADFSGASLNGTTGLAWQGKPEL